MTTLSTLEVEIVRQQAARSLAVHIPLVHKTDDGSAAIPPQHLLDQVIPVLEDDSLGHTVIIAPPGSAKTNTMIAYSHWRIGRDNTRHLGYICNNTDRAVERSLAIQAVIQSAPYRAIFPNVIPDKTRGWKQDEWYVERPNLSDKNPTMLAAGVGSSIIGARLDDAILDDIADADNMATLNQRQALRTWLEQTLMTRMHPEKGRIIMICTRWHEDDPAAWAIERGWHVVHIKALDEQGESYWPGFYPTSFLACKDDQHAGGQCCIKNQLGAGGFGKQYQGEVMSEEASLFRRVNWGRYQPRDLPLKLQQGAIFVDLAHTEKQSNDFTTIAPILAEGPRRYWLSLFRQRVEFPEAMRAIQQFKRQYPHFPIVIEDGPNSKPLIQALQRIESGVIAWPTLGRSKLARAQAAAPAHESGEWFLPVGVAWAEAVIEEHAFFPAAKHDDTVDLSSLQHDYFFKKRPNFVRKTTPGGRIVLARV